MNFQLKLYQLIKPRLRDQKYEISSGSSLLSFESDWYSGKQPVARCCCSLPLGQPLLCSRHFHSTARQGLADWSPPLFIWGIGSSWGTSNNPGWRLYSQGTEGRGDSRWSHLTSAQHGKHTHQGLNLPVPNLSLFSVPVNLIEILRNSSQGIFILLLPLGLY